MHSIDSESDSKKTNEKDAPSSPLVKPMDDNADQYIYLHIPKSEMDDLDIKKLLLNSERDTEKPSEKTDKLEKKENAI